jgi:hypothetical protein
MDQGHLVHMANQIARNLAAQGEDAAVTMMAQHLKDFWDPRGRFPCLPCAYGPLL